MRGAGDAGSAGAVARSGRPGDPCVVVIFGAAGDLTKRKLLPAIYNLQGHGLMPRDFAIVGVARREMATEAFRAEQAKDIKEFATTTVEPEAWSDFESRLYYVDGELGDAETYSRLAALLREVDERHGTRGNFLFYLATPPAVFGEVVRRLGEAGLAREEEGHWRRVIVEKPFGRDLDSACALNREINGVLEESQIYRIDHYLGKETVQNIMVLRFANGIFEPIWNRRYIDHVQVLVAESVGIEGRGNYYETAGALRDMVQNHMLQLLALVAMEPPTSLAADDVRDEKAKVLRAIRPLTPEQVLQHGVRGQYGAGEVGGQPVPGYRSEPHVRPDSPVETYTALELSIENWRWAGVPFYLRTGKRLARRYTQVVVEFRAAPHLLFSGTSADPVAPNRLLLDMQPVEGMRLDMQAKVPGPTIRMKSVQLAFSYKDFGGSKAGTGYETLLYDCMIGDSTRFHRWDTVEAAWEVATPILDVWASLRPRDFPNYAAGSWGPSAADQLVGRTGRRWFNPE